jgi:hypothetical protein
MKAFDTVPHRLIDGSSTDPCGIPEVTFDQDDFSPFFATCWALSHRKLDIQLSTGSSTPNCMLYGELGRYPLNITVKLKILSFWSTFKTSKYFSNLKSDLNNL